jgi:hypothetical protein
MLLMLSIAVTAGALCSALGEATAWTFIPTVAAIAGIIDLSGG